MAYWTFKIQLDSLHYRPLRLVKNDFKQKNRKIWIRQNGQSPTNNLVMLHYLKFIIKIIRDKTPCRIFEYILQTMYYERRRVGVLRFYDTSHNRGGFQMIGNHLKSLFEHNKPFSLNESNDAIRVKLKRIWGFADPNSTSTERWPILDGDPSMTAVVGNATLKTADDQ